MCVGVALADDHHQLRRDTGATKVTLTNNSSSPSDTRLPSVSSRRTKGLNTLLASPSAFKASAPIDVLVQVPVVVGVFFIMAVAAADGAAAVAAFAHGWRAVFGFDVGDALRRTEQRFAEMGKEGSLCQVPSLGRGGGVRSKKTLRAIDADISRTDAMIKALQIGAGDVARPIRPGPC